MSGTRIRPDKQIQTAPGAGYVLHSDGNGELQFALLSSLASGNGNTDFAVGDVRSIDSIELSGSTLFLNYTDNQGRRFTRTCDLRTLAVDVKVEGAILQRPDANTYILQLTQTDGSTVTLNLSDLLAVITANSADIIFSGKGTTSDPLTAVLSDAAKAALVGGAHWTDEFTGLTTGNTVRLSYPPLYPFPIHVYRNGLRQKEFLEWKYNPEDPMTLTLQSIHFGTSGQAETVIVDYMTAESTKPRVLS